MSCQSHKWAPLREVLAEKLLLHGGGVDHLEATILKLLGRLSYDERKTAYGKIKGMREFRTASVCSGTSMDHIVIESIFRVFDDTVPGKCCYVCESVPKNRTVALGHQDAVGFHCRVWTASA